MSLHNRDLAKKRNNLMIQRRELASKPLPNSKTQEEKENEEVGLFNGLNPGNPGLAAGRFFPVTTMLLGTPIIGPRGVTVQSLCNEGMVSPMIDLSGHPICPGTLPIKMGQFL